MLHRISFLSSLLLIFILFLELSITESLIYSHFFNSTSFEALAIIVGYYCSIADRPEWFLSCTISLIFYGSLISGSILNSSSLDKDDSQTIRTAYLLGENGALCGNSQWGHKLSC